MRKILRLLRWIIGDLNESSMAIAKIYANEEESEIADQIIKASGKIVEAKKAIIEAMDILEQIYERCYGD